VSSPRVSIRAGRLIRLAATDPIQESLTGVAGPRMQYTSIEKIAERNPNGTKRRRELVGTPEISGATDRQLTTRFSVRT